MAVVAEWYELVEVVERIVSFLPAEDIGRAAGVCSLWSKVARKPSVWRDKSFLSEDGHRLSDVLSVARVLPALRSVSVRTSEVSRIYLNGESAEFELPNSRDEVVMSAISALVTDELSFEYPLLDEKRSNCLVVQLHELKMLTVRARPGFVPSDKAAEDKLRALSSTLSREPLPNLQSVDISFVDVDLSFGNVDSDILRSLPSGLQRLRLVSPRVMSHSLIKILQRLPRLTILHVVLNKVESLQYLSQCPGLTELHVGPKCDILFSESYGKWRIRHFSQLGGLTSLKKLCITYPRIDVEPLADVLSKMPMLEVLRVGFQVCVSDLSFLRSCRGLHCLRLRYYFGFGDSRLSFRELSHLKELRKLVLEYPYLHSEDLVDVLPSMPHLEELNVVLVDTECHLSFLRHCVQLTCLVITFQYGLCNLHLTRLRHLRCLRRLTVIDLPDKYRQSLAEKVLELPKLEYLCLERDGPNLLESHEWPEMLSRRSNV